MTDLQSREQQLRAQLETLSARLERIEAHIHRTPDPDSEDRATEAEMDEVLDGLSKSGATEIGAIIAAIARLKEGSYGICLRCGASISEERLDAVPHATSCKVCARATN